MYLGPVVAAQQVLDPSPKHTHLREEKGGGGGTPDAAKSSGVYPRVQVLVTSPDVYGKVSLAREGDYEMMSVRACVSLSRRFLQNYYSYRFFVN